MSTFTYQPRQHQFSGQTYLSEDSNFTSISAQFSNVGSERDTQNREPQAQPRVRVLPTNPPIKPVKPLISNKPLRENNLGSNYSHSTKISHQKNYCILCAQTHDKITQNHIFNYLNNTTNQEIKKALTCTLCHQPFIQPVDLKCGHTFCSLCIELKFEEASSYNRACVCPECNEPMNPAKDMWKSSIVIYKLTGEMLVSCPHQNCRMTLHRCKLLPHLQKDCGSHNNLLENLANLNVSGSNSYSSDDELGSNSNSNHDSNTTLTSRLTKIPQSIKNDKTITVHLAKNKSTNNWGLRFVGGKDTPIKSIIIQDGSNCDYVTSNFMKHKNDKNELMPGDIIVALNDTPIPYNAVA